MAAAEAGSTSLPHSNVEINTLTASALTPTAAMTALLRGPDGATGSVATNADNGSLEALGVRATGDDESSGSPGCEL